MAQKSIEEYKRELEGLHERLKDNRDYSAFDDFGTVLNNCEKDYPLEPVTHWYLGVDAFYGMIHQSFDYYGSIQRFSRAAQTNPLYLEAAAGFIAACEQVESCPPDVRDKPQKDFARAFYLEATIGLYEWYYHEKPLLAAYQNGYSTSDFPRFFDKTVNRISFKDDNIFHNQELDNLFDKKEIYFLGDNGVGKTMLMNSIIDSFAGIGDNEWFTGAAKQNYIPFLKRESSDHIELHAYGTARTRMGIPDDPHFDKQGYGTVLNRELFLTNVEWFLKDIQRKGAIGQDTIPLQTVLTLFKDLINFDGTKGIDIKYDTRKDQFLFYENGVERPFTQLAEGYRTTLIWLSDLLSRQIKRKPYLTKLEDIYAVVLIDEIDLFLHPKWQYNLMRLLRAKLPNIQWILTTHSPALIMGASEDAVIYKLYKDGAKTRISEPYTHREIGNLLANGIITSPLFDLEYSGMRVMLEKSREEWDAETGNHFLSDRIHKWIAERLKSRGQKHLSLETIDSWINEALDLNETGNL